MYNKLTLAKKYLHHHRVAYNSRGHGIHSPFVFDFVKNVLRDDRDFYAFVPIEKLRLQLQADHSTIKLNDLGAGSAVTKEKRRTIASIAKHSLKSKKLARLLFRMVNYYQPVNIIELGTAFGLTTAYLAAANGNASVFTIEGAPALAALARKNFEQLNLFNTKLLEGHFDALLPSLLADVGSVDLAFVDGNHRLEPTMHYFDLLLRHSNEKSILIFDDIHWSEEMETAWKKIQSHPSVTCTVDLFFLGLVFLRKEFKIKQHFIIRF